MGQIYVAGYRSVGIHGWRERDVYMRLDKYVVDIYMAGYISVDIHDYI